MKKSWNLLANTRLRYQNENIISYLLRLRRVRDEKRFLNPTYRDLLPYESMKNIKEAAKAVILGIFENKKFYIHYDCDLDGIASGTIMNKYLQFQGATNIVYDINNGKIHGISHKNLSDFEGTDILIIVDSLDNDYKMYDALHEKGIKIIILDHHEFDEYPESAILVSSAMNYENKHLSGAGVTWKFCAYLDSVLETNHAKSLLDLAACGIIADVCDISENSYENRYIVNCGLNNLQRPALESIVGSYEFNSQSIIWSIAPLINAANRTGNNDIPVQMFLADDKKLIKSYLKQLKEIKEEQNKSIAETANNLELQILQNNDMENDKVIFGVVPQGDFTGLIATQIANKYQKPTIIFHAPSEDFDTNVKSKQTGLKGSIRAYGIDNFKSIINGTKIAACFGHESAAGINCNRERLTELKEAINSKFKDVEFVLKKDIDLGLELFEISNDLILALNKINKITGNGFKPISVCIKDVEIQQLITMQDKHTKFTSGEIVFIKWNDVEIAKEIQTLQADEEHYVIVDVVGELSMSNFAGKKSKQFIINDYDNVVSLPEFLR